MGFAVSLGVTLAGAALQTKQLVKQTKAINVHGVERHKLSTQAQSEIESSRPYMKKREIKRLINKMSYMLLTFKIRLKDCS